MHQVISYEDQFISICLMQIVLVFFLEKKKKIVYFSCFVVIIYLIFLSTSAQGTNLPKEIFKSADAVDCVLTLNVLVCSFLRFYSRGAYICTNVVRTKTAKKRNNNDNSNNAMMHPVECNKLARGRYFI